VQALHVAERPDFFKPSNQASVVAYFESLLEKPKARIWLADVAGLAVGYILVLHNERPENPFCFARRWHELDQIAVDPSWRRQGICRALIQRALDEACQVGVRDVEVSSWSFNTTAHRAFERAGFKRRMFRFEATGLGPKQSG
jgi:GNAT superfamily N-acetyltransferase